MTNYSTRFSRPTGRRFGSPPPFMIFFIAAVFLFVIGGFVFNVVALNTPSSATACVVTDKDRTTNSDGDSDMRIYTENCGVLSVGDNLFTGTFNSADIYGSIEVGGTYDFEMVGFRIPLFSMFPIINTVTPV